MRAKIFTSMLLRKIPGLLIGIFFLFFNSIGIFGQGTEWVKTMGSSTADQVRSVASDSLGNIYACGDFTGTVDFNPNPLLTDNRTATGSNAAFITKYDADGAYQWTVVLNGAHLQYLWDIDIIHTGSYKGIYVAGTYSGSVDLDPLEGESIYTAQESLDCFAARYSLEDGSLLSSYVYSGVGDEDARNIEVTNDNYVFVSGTFSQQIDFTPDDPGSLHSSNGGDDLFVRAFHAVGGLFYNRAIGGAGAENAMSMDVDVNNNVYLGGSFEQTVDFDPDNTTTYDLTSAGSKDAYLLSLDFNGDFRFAKQIGGTSEVKTSSIIVSDESIRTAVEFGGTISMVVGYVGGFPVFQEFNSSGGYDVLLTQYDLSGSINTDNLVQYGGSINDLCTGLLEDGHGNIYTLGYFASTDFDADPGENQILHSSNGFYDIYMIAFDSNYGYKWSRSIGGSGNDYAFEGVIYPADSLYTVGAFNSEVDFATDGESIIRNSSGTEDLFILKTQIYSKETDIEDFVFSEEAEAAIINSNDHTVQAKVLYGSDIANLSPTITLSGGASSVPASGVARDFTSMVNYQVIAEDTAYKQDWTVEVTKALNHNTDIESFTLESQTSPAEINTTEHSVSIEVAYGTKLLALTPVISVSEGGEISPASGVEQDFSGPVAYTVTAENGTNTQQWTVEVAEAMNDATDITNFVVDEQVSAAEIDNTNHEILVKVEDGTDLTNLSPDITVSPGASVNPSSGASQDFSDNVSYTVTAENGTDQQEWIVEVAFASGLDDPSMNELKLYPNPVSDKLHISLSLGKVNKVNLYDVTGRLVLSKKPNLQNFDLETSMIIEGVYIVEIFTSNNKRFSKGVVIDH